MHPGLAVLLFIAITITAFVCGRCYERASKTVDHQTSGAKGPPKQRDFTSPFIWRLLMETVKHQLNETITELKATNAVVAALAQRVEDLAKTIAHDPEPPVVDFSPVLTVLAEIKEQLVTDKTDEAPQGEAAAEEQQSAA